MGNRSRQVEGDKGPLISVIIPVYNVAPYLRRCVDSLFAQTFRDFELILVDDGSTDSSAAICDSYKDEDAKVNAKVKVIHQPNAGVSTARNRGIEAAQGEYISFIDADDWVEPDFLKTFADHLVKQADLYIQGFYEESGRCYCMPFAAFSGREEISQSLCSLHANGLDCYVWNKLFKRTLLEEWHIRFDTQVSLGEDYLFCIEYITRINSLVVDGHTYYVYNNKTSNYSGTQLMNQSAVNDRATNLLKPFVPPSVLQQFKAHHLVTALHSLIHLYKAKNPANRRFLWQVKAHTLDIARRDMRSFEQPYSILYLIIKYLPEPVCHVVLTFLL